MKIAHFSDCHISGHFCPEIIPSLFSKRITGMTNLYLKRKYQLLNSENNLYRVLKSINAVNPDYIVFSGDISALSLKDEFFRAKEIIYNSIEKDKIMIIPGNHDIYTFLTSKYDLFHKIFTSKYDLISRFPYPKIRFFNNEILFLSLNTSRFNPLFMDASGYVKEDEISFLEDYLKDIPDNIPRFLIIHHSIFLPDGTIDTYFHRLRNYKRILHFIKKNNIKYLLSGHIHKNYIIYNKEYDFTQYNPGSTAKNQNYGYFLYDLNKDNRLEYKFIYPE